MKHIDIPKKWRKTDGLFNEENGISQACRVYTKGLQDQNQWLTILCKLVGRLSLRAFSEFVIYEWKKMR